MKKTIKKVMGFTPTGGGNEILAGKGFFISYKSGFVPNLISMFAADDDSDETAIVADGKYLILNGDFRKDYHKLIKSKTACIKFFKSKEKKYKSSWSDTTK